MSREGRYDGCDKFAGLASETAHARGGEAIPFPSLKQHAGFVKYKTRNALLDVRQNI